MVNDTVLDQEGLKMSKSRGNIVDPWYTILSTEEKAALDAYESLYGVRRVVWYAYPSPTLGFNTPPDPGGADWSGAPLPARFTPAAPGGSG